MENLKLFSKNLQTLLDANGLTNRELAEILGLSESTVGKWLLCRNTPTLGNVQKIADYFDVSMSDLLRSDDFYYIDQNSRTVADEISKDKDLRLLFDAARNVKGEDLRAVAEVLKSLKQKERGIIDEITQEAAEDEF